MEINKKKFRLLVSMLSVNYIVTLLILLFDGIDHDGSRCFFPYFGFKISIFCILTEVGNSADRFRKACIWSLLLVASHILAGLSLAFFIAESFNSAIRWLILLILTDFGFALFLFLPLNFVFFYELKKE